ncbi:MAG: 2-dehydropantoate 2-reductase [Proteobacteria bacterium]|nr:2-dehydropantoate 2-reductase [Pseudomonadota bacterium]
MKTVIIGPGAMGCLYAFLLTRAGYETWLLDCREDRAERIRAQGLKIEGLSGDYQLPFPRISAFPHVIAKADLLILFVKAYNTATALESARELVTANTIILTLQNGIGNVEAIREAYPHHAIVAGTTAQGATLLGCGHIRHAGMGETIIGGIDANSLFHAKLIKDLFMSAYIPTEMTEDVKGILWGKLLINCAINPLTAIMRVPNGQLPKIPDLCEIMSRAVEEGAAIARSAGITLPYSDQVAKVMEVCEATAGNRSSMLQDIEAGRKTEINYLNGALVRYGKETGVAAPVNSFLTHLVQALETGSSAVH